MVLCLSPGILRRAEAFVIYKFSRFEKNNTKAARCLPSQGFFGERGSEEGVWSADKVGGLTTC